MYEFIKGGIKELTPTYVVIECNGLGYLIHISLNTFTQLTEKKEALILIHEVIREDAHLLFGFFTKNEREVFRHLISVSGVGANTARMMLSSLSSSDIQLAIVNQNVGLLKSIKGIGSKTAERIIIDLKDKLGKIETDTHFFSGADNTIKEEALSALVMLGFPKNQAEKVVGKVVNETGGANVEEIIKEALKRL